MSVLATTFSKTVPTSSTLRFLRVAAGVHHGVTLSTCAAASIIGADEADDVVLTDRGVSAGHVRLCYHPRYVLVQALGAPVTVAKAGRPDLNIEQGFGCRAHLPFTLVIGEAALEVFSPAGEALSKELSDKGKFTWLAAGAFMFVCAGAVAMLRPPAEPDSIYFVNSLPATAAGVEAIPRSIAQARSDIEERGSEAGLREFTVTADDEQLTVKGAFTAAQRQRWLALQQYFDRSYGDRFVLDSSGMKERAPGPTPTVHLQAAWFGEDPYVIDSSGTRLAVGAPLKDGWVIDQIRDETIVMARGEERFNLTLAPARADDS